jgi:hypothetical protein
VTPDVFRVQMERLLGLRFIPASFDTHWEALNDLPEDVFAAAVSRAQRTRVDFPTPVELRQDADQVAPRKAPRDEPSGREHPVREVVCEALGMKLTLKVTREWVYDCEICSDSGWEPFWCGPSGVHQRQWLEARRCDKRSDHAPHEWVAPCPCRATNPTIQRRIDREAKYAEKPGRAA